MITLKLSVHVNFWIRLKVIKKGPDENLIKDELRAVFVIYLLAYLFTFYLQKSKNRISYTIVKYLMRRDMYT